MNEGTTGEGGELIACPHCDLLLREVELPHGGIAHCVRCDAELYRGRRHSLDRSLALGIAAAQFLLLANVFPLVSMRVQGDDRSITLPQAAWSLWEHGMAPLATLVFTTTILVPALEITLIVYLLLSLRFGRSRYGFGTLFRIVQAIRRWGFMDVLMLGILVSLVKLASLAEVIPGVALWAFAGLIFLMVGLSLSFNARDVWRWSREAHP